MKYTGYQLEFPNGVRFGNGNLSGTEITFHADTLFSALFQEALKLQMEGDFLNYIEKNQLVFSDGFPYIGKQLFLPKPLLHIQKNSGNEKGDSKEKKRIKNMKYIPQECISAYRKGMMTSDQMEALKELGHFGMKTAVGIRGNDEPEPYRVSAYYFKPDNGVYVIVGYETEMCKSFFESLLESLSYTGIGGKKSSGLGRFEYKECTLSDEMQNRLMKPGKEKMLLSTAMPEEQELIEVLQGSTYSLLKRGGFIDSDRYAEQQMRKGERYVFLPGSCFQKDFKGTVITENNGGAHLIFRYEKALFLGVDL